MMLIELQPLPSQTLAVALAQQPAQLAVRQMGDALFFDLSVNNVSIVRTRICRDRQRLLVDAKYRGFVGDFAFVDTQGVSDPQYFGLGGRYRLYYLGAGE